MTGATAGRVSCVAGLLTQFAVATCLAGQPVPAPSRAGAPQGIAERCARLVSSDPRALPEWERLARAADAAGEARVALRCRGRAAMARSYGPEDREFLRDGLRALIRTADSLGDRAEAARLRGLRGSGLISPGALGEAVDDLERSMRDATAEGDSGTALWSAGNLAQAYYALGDLVSARGPARRAIALGERSGGPAELSLALSLRGDLATAAGAWTAADTWYDSAGRVARRGGYHAGSAHALELQANVAMRRAAWARADSLLARALDALRLGGYGENASQLQYLRGTVAMRRGRLEDARRWLALAHDGTADDGNLQYFVGAREAELALVAGDLALAEQRLRAAGEARERWRRTLMRSDIRLAAFQAAPDEADPDLGVASILAALVRAGRADDAFGLAEQARARDLFDRLRPAPGAPLSPEAVTGLAAQVRRVLPEGVALVEFVVGLGMEPTTVFMLTREGLHAWTTTPVDSLVDDISRFRAILEGDGNPRPVAARLGAALFGGAQALLGDRLRSVIVVPDGALHRVPFDALVLSDGRYVFEHVATSVAPSARVAAELMRRASPSHPATILAVGDPRFPGPPADEDAPLASWAPLPASREEVALVAGYGRQGRVLLGPDASERAVVQALGGASVVHFATHALADEATPARISLVLTPGSGEDGYLTSGEIAPLRLDADLVVLSACRSAIGPTVRGEGMQGLTAPFLAAGVRSLLATQWFVGDRSTVALVRTIYDSLAAGHPVAEALRLARLDGLRRGLPPRQWAVFVAVGDPMVSVLLQRPGGRRAAIGRFGLVAVLGLAGAVLWRVRRRRGPGASPPATYPSGA